MADQEQEKIKASYFWLNPSVKTDGIYRLHVNYADMQGRWKYDERPPYRLTLAEKMVFTPELITEDDIKTLEPDFPNTNIKKIRLSAYGQFDKHLMLMANIKAANRNVRNILRVYGDWKRRKNEAEAIIREAELTRIRKIEYHYIGNTKPIALGITAFFIKRSVDGQQDRASLWDIMSMYRDYDMLEWYEMYYQEQLNRWEKVNKKLTLAQSRLSQEVLIDNFTRTHLDSEQMYFKESQVIFSSILNDKVKDSISILMEYAMGYQEWVSKKIKRPIQAFTTKLNNDQMLLLHGNMGGVMKVAVDDFLEIFSGKPIFRNNLKAEWIDPYRGKPNKTTLRAFLEFMVEPDDLDKNPEIPLNQMFFVDQNGQLIKLNKRGDKDNLKAFKDTFQKMIK